MVEEREEDRTSERKLIKGETNTLLTSGSIDSLATSANKEKDEKLEKSGCGGECVCVCRGEETGRLVRWTRDTNTQEM